MPRSSKRSAESDTKQNENGSASAAAAASGATDASPKKLKPNSSSKAADAAEGEGVVVTASGARDTAKTSKSVEEIFPIDKYIKAGCVVRPEWRGVLEAEIELMYRRERVAALRRTSMPHFPVQKSYTFDTAPALATAASSGQQQVKVAKNQSFQSLFAGRKYLIIAQIMFEPGAVTPCMMCASWAHGYNATAKHLMAKADTQFVAMTKAPIEQWVEYARAAGWDQFPLVSSFGTSFNADFGCETAKGQQQMPGINVFELTNAGASTGASASGGGGTTISHTYFTQMINGDLRHQRGIDPYNALWHLLDCAAAGRGAYYPPPPKPVHASAASEKAAEEKRAMMLANDAAKDSKKKEAEAVNPHLLDDKIPIEQQWPMAQYLVPSAVMHEEWKPVLRAEVELMWATERVARLRRTLPRFKVEKQYTFEVAATTTGSGSGSGGGAVPPSKTVTLSELFGTKSHLVIAHTMFGPEDLVPCMMCCAWADVYDAVSPHLNHPTSNIAFVIMCKKGWIPLNEFAAHHGWKNGPLVSCEKSTFNYDFGAEGKSGDQKPTVTAFTKDAHTGTVYHTWTNQMSLPDFEHRGIDTFYPLWHLFDLLPNGREMQYPVPPQPVPAHAAAHAAAAAKPPK